MDKVYFGYLFSSVSLGSIQELPAKSCAEIKASEGKEMAEGKRWIYSDESAEQAIQASCHGTLVYFLSLIATSQLSPLVTTLTGNEVFDVVVKFILIKSPDEWATTKQA